MEEKNKDNNISDFNASDENISKNNESINDKKDDENNNFYFKNIKSELTKMRNLSIIGICLALTVFGFVGTIAIQIICGIKILSNDWKDEELNEQKLIWGILSFVGLGCISSLIFSCIGISNIEKKYKI